MSRLSARPGTWTVWGSLLCLTLSCSSEEAGTGPGGETSATGTDGADPNSGSGIPSAPVGPVSSMNGTATNDTTTNEASTSGTGASPTTDTAVSPTTDNTAVSPTTDTGTSGPASNETETTGQGTEPGGSTVDDANTSDETSGTEDTSGSGPDDETSGTEPDGDTGTDTETTDETTSTGGPSSGGDCTPNSSGDLVAEGEVVLDQKTCLTWMKSDVTGHPYTEADAYCANLSLGGHDDWRLPTAGEATTIFHCQGTYPPVYDAFTAMYDGIWTTTETGTIAGDEPKVCGAGQASGQFYDFGKVGAQNTRCVRGPVTVADRADCKTNNQVCQ